MGLFHYTSNVGLTGILHSKCLFATNYKYLNDSEEMNMARPLIIPVFEKDFESEATVLIAEGHLRDTMLKDHGRGIYKQEANNLLNAAVETADRLAPVFITSFCTHDEPTYQWRHGLLSQWRAYGSKGGCAIEFDREKMVAMFDLEGETYRYNQVALKDVVYENYDQVLDVSKLSGLARLVLRKMVLGEEVGDEANELYYAISFAAPQMKHRSFSEERETRVIASLVKSKTNYSDASKKPRSVFYRDKEGLPCPTIRLLEGFDQLPIKRVIIGPQRNQDQVAYAVNMALEQYGITAGVVLSEIPYVP
ncbi:DUF2971 domain-containing protein [Methylobacterium sp. WL122]|nr:DUF2971 domain-containing protein [Methylobacterium sp. WL122]